LEIPTQVNVRPDKKMLVNAIRRIVHRANQFTEFIHVVLWTVSLGAVTMVDIKIRLIAYLDTYKVFPQVLLA
jgi:hypothetical protein